MTRKLLPLLLILSLLGFGLPVAGAQGACSGTSYTVVTGDTLAGISLRFGVSQDAIIAANGITNPNLIFIAQALCIPSGNAALGQGGGEPLGTGGTTTGTAPSTSDVVNQGTSVDPSVAQFIFPEINQGGGGVVAGRVTLGNQAVVVDFAPSTEGVVPAGTLIPDIGQSTTARIGYNDINNAIHITSGGMIPYAQVRIYISRILGDRDGGVVGYLMADGDGVVDGYIRVPSLVPGTRQFVMIRAYDGRTTWGYFDIVGLRFP